MGEVARHGASLDWLFSLSAVFWGPARVVAASVAQPSVLLPRTAARGAGPLSVGQVPPEGPLALLLTFVCKCVCEHFSGISGERSVVGLYEACFFSF